MPPPEERRESNEIHQTLRLGNSGEESDFVLDQTDGSRLNVTLRNGDANVSQLRLLIPDFEIVEELGRGAFGVVYRARDTKLDRHVAIKVSLLDDSTRREQYIREARAAAKLDTAGIVPVYQVGTLADGQPFVVQRLIEGSTLRKILAEQGTLDLRRACKLLIDIAEAVAHAHAVGMIHRDLKPDNILVDAAGRPWVADFGLAILEEDQKQYRGERAGTPLYMSPEQLLGRTEWLDGRTDIYALGIMLYEMLTGRPPFDAQSLAELEEQVLHRDPKPISQRAPQLPAVMDVIFQNCCAKQVNDRYANAQELVADLQAVMAELTELETSAVPQGRMPGGYLAGQHSYVPLPVSQRRKTLWQSGGLRNTLRQTDAPASNWKNYGKPLTVGAIVMVLLAGLWLWRFTPETAPEPPPLVNQANATDADPLAHTATANTATVVPSLAGDSPAPDVASTPPAAPSTTPASPPLPARPFRVSKGSEGTHATIGEALTMANEDETIYILPGHYVESLALDRNITLVGQGDRESIVIVGENQSAVTVQNKAQVALQNLTVDGIKSTNQDLNTIDVQTGKLTLQDCHVYSRSYDCVKLAPSCGLSASGCRFHSANHPAISADQAQQLLLINCSFDIRPPTLESSTTAVGVQAIQCAGTLRQCSFVGSGKGVGIHWQASSLPVSIENCNFENCDTGIVVQSCRQVTIGGKPRSQFHGCQQGLLIEQSAATLFGLDIAGTSNSYGIRIVDSDEVNKLPQVSIDQTSISGYRISLSIERAHALVNNFASHDSREVGVRLVAQGQLTMHASSISHSELTGLHIEDGSARLSDCQFSSNAYAGITVDSHSQALTADNCQFVENTSGLLITSGTATLAGGQFDSNKAGLLVISHELLKQRPTGEPSPIVLDLQQVVFQNQESGELIIRAPCRYRITEPNDTAPGRLVSPKIAPELKAAKVGDETIVQTLEESTDPLKQL